MIKISQFKNEFFFLSNFYPCTLIIDGEKYSTLEHAYQASKFESKIIRDLIRDATTPGKAKRLGRRTIPKNDWENIKISTMKQLLQQKFQNPMLRLALAETGNMILEEENTWNDKFWGVYEGEGENWLGKLLMEVRNEILIELKKEEEDFSTAVNYSPSDGTIKANE